MHTQVFRLSKFQQFCRKGLRCLAAWMNVSARVVTCGRGLKWPAKLKSDLEASSVAYDEAMEFHDYADKVRSGEIPSRTLTGLPRRMR